MKNSIKKNSGILLDNKRDISNFILGCLIVLSIIILLSSGVNKKAMDIYNLCNSLEKESLYDINYENIVNQIIKAIPEDKYIRYINSRALEFETNKDNGKSTKFGLLLDIEKTGFLKVIGFNTEDAKNSGILIGDIIVKINDNIVDFRNYEKMTWQERIEKNFTYFDTTKNIIKYTIKREEKEMTYNIEIVNSEIETVSSQRINDLGYIIISEFNNNTKDEFIKAYESFNNINSLIIDLRDNGGGFVDIATEIADFLMPKGVMVELLDKNNNCIGVYKSDDKCIDLPIYVLINSNTASSSEILASSLKNLGNATIVGTNSYGKTIGQERINLSNGTYVYFTNFKINSFIQEQGKGIQPDYYVEYKNDDTKEYSLELDNQLQFTIDLIKENIVKKAE